VAAPAAKSPLQDPADLDRAKLSTWLVNYRKARTGKQASSSSAFAEALEEGDFLCKEAVEELLGIFESIGLLRDAFTGGASKVNNATFRQAGHLLRKVEEFPITYAYAQRKAVEGLPARGRPAANRSQELAQAFFLSCHALTRHKPWLEEVASQARATRQELRHTHKEGRPVSPVEPTASQVSYVTSLTGCCWLHELVGDIPACEMPRLLTSHPTYM
jgi:hypothetical protein